MQDREGKREHEGGARKQKSVWHEDMHGHKCGHE